jgi:protein-disulfide isomerase
MGRIATAACVELVLALLAMGGAVAGERIAEITREEVVATIERAPGPSRGRADAPVVLVEFSDFQCGYCRVFRDETLPQLEAQYIQPGKVRFVYRHLAVLGEASVAAARASACAFGQDKFWEYHDALFRATSPFAFRASRLKQYAADLKLDGKTFAACLDGKKYARVVEAETMLGRALGATGTPSFLVNGQLLIGAYPFEVFQKVLDETLAGAARKPGTGPR